MCLPDEFNMKIQSLEIVGGTALGDLAESWYSHHQRCALRPSGRVVVMMRLPDEFDMMIQPPRFVGGTVFDDLPEHGGVEKALKVFSPSAL